MLKTSSGAVLFLSTLAIVAVGHVSESEAQIQAVPNLTIAATCLTEAPAATLTIASNSDGTKESTSPDGSYTAGACHGYVVEVKVSGLNAGYGLQTNGGLANPPASEFACGMAQDHVAFYRKAAGATTFTAVGGGFRKGSWVAPGQLGSGCNMNPVPTNWVQNRNQTWANGDTWRVVVRGVTSAEPAKVKVTANPYKPPA